MLVLLSHSILLYTVGIRASLTINGITGLVNALKLLQPVKDKYSGVTYADLFQLASATAVEDIVALSGAHTLGRASPERSGWGKPETKYT
ncbi:hypothetical protein B296_00004507, partial [Ensete ventricosum]